MLYQNEIDRRGGDSYQKSGGGGGGGGGGGLVAQLHTAKGSA